MSNRMQEFVEGFRALRRRRGLSQADVARFSGRTQSRISEVESAFHDPRLSTVLDALHAVGGQLMAIPSEHVAAVRALIAPAADKKEAGDVFDDVFVAVPRGGEGGEETDRKDERAGSDYEPAERRRGPAP